MNIGYGKQVEVLTIKLVVVYGPDLMGLDRLSHFDVINLGEVIHIRKPLQEILDEHAVVLNKEPESCVGHFGSSPNF